MPIEDGIRKATKNLDKAAGAAPTSEVADGDKFGMKGEVTDEHAHDEARTHDDGGQSDASNESEESED